MEADALAELLVLVALMEAFELDAVTPELLLLELEEDCVGVCARTAKLGQTRIRRRGA